MATPLPAPLFGSPAWKVAPRDSFIGWNTLERKQYLHLIANNLQFLILPWVRVPHLASHILVHIAHRISDDWMPKYGHPIYLLETFVERERFQGTSYKAANWLLVGQTKGRTRNDRYNTIRVPNQGHLPLSPYPKLPGGSAWHLLRDIPRKLLWSGCSPQQKHISIEYKDR